MNRNGSWWAGGRWCRVKLLRFRKGTFIRVAMVDRLSRDLVPPYEHWRNQPQCEFLSAANPLATRHKVLLSLIGEDKIRQELMVPGRSRPPVPTGDS